MIQSRMRPMRKPIHSPTEIYEAYEQIVKRFKVIDKLLEETMNEPAMKRAFCTINHKRKDDLINTVHSFYKYIAELTGRMEMMKKEHGIGEPQIMSFPKFIPKTVLAEMVKLCPDRNKRGHSGCEVCDFQADLKKLLKGSRK